MLDKETVSKVMSDLGKRSHKKKPRSKAFYQAMQKKSVAKRRLSTVRIDLPQAKD